MSARTLNYPRILNFKVQDSVVDTIDGIIAQHADNPDSELFGSNRSQFIRRALAEKVSKYKDTGK